MYPPAVIAASDLVSNDLDKAQRLVGVLVFFLCAIGIPAAPVAYLSTSQSARDRLSEARGWLLSRRTKVGGFRWWRSAPRSSSRGSFRCSEPRLCPVGSNSALWVTQTG